jgi:hypothetical protein
MKMGETLAQNRAFRKEFHDDPDIKRGYDLREKFDLYVVTLNFTLLGLAIQTARVSLDYRAVFAELLGWALLAIAGLLSLWRVFGTTTAHVATVRKSIIDDLTESGLSDEQRARNAADKLSKASNRTIVWNAIIYAVQWLAFLFGVSSVMFSRGSVLLAAL